MDRDPLHDSVLEDATAAEDDDEEGAESDQGSVPTSPMTAAERDHPPTTIPPGMPPNGPLPPQPVNVPLNMAYFRARRMEPSAGSTSASAGVDSTGAGTARPTGAPPGEAEGTPSSLAANILHHLQLTGPATPAEEYVLPRTDPRDLRNALFDLPDRRGSSHDTAEGAHGVSAEGGVEGDQESEGHTTDPNASDSVQDRATVPPPSDNLAATSITSTLPPLEGHPHHADLAGAVPNDTDTLYESEDGLVCFDLGLATACLRETREWLSMYREDARGSGTSRNAERSRSRSRPGSLLQIQTLTTGGHTRT
ncbi:unnamed protein product [Symbiodinium sp. CCMP2592]|nr:unnamed protein product [Symbiodinium sp. CCMP2592]